MALWLPRGSQAVVATTASRMLFRSPLTYRHLHSLRPSPSYPLVLYTPSARRLQSTSSGDKSTPPSEPKPAVPVVHKEPLAPRIWKKVKHEAQHYWHGTKLLVSEVRISARLQWKILQGETLTRRERRQVTFSSPPE